MRTRGYTPWRGIPSFTTSLRTDVGDGPGLATDSVVLCTLRHNKTACANSEGSKFTLSSLNNTVSNLHSQGVTQASRERSPFPRMNSIHPQGVATTFLEKGRDHSHTWRVHIHQNHTRRVHIHNVWRGHPCKGRDRSHTWKVHIHKVWQGHPWKGRDHSHTWRVYIHKVRH